MKCGLIPYRNFYQKSCCRAWGLMELRSKYVQNKSRFSHPSPDEKNSINYTLLPLTNREFLTIKSDLER